MACVQHPPERVSAPPPQPPQLLLSGAFAPPATPGPSPQGSCLLPVPHRGRFPSLPVGGFDSCLALCADMCWWQFPKRGEGNPPNNRGRLWGSAGGCVLLLLALISLPLVQSAGLEVLTKEQKSMEGGEREREPAFGSTCACSPLSTCPESRATLFS